MKAAGRALLLATLVALAGAALCPPSRAATYDGVDDWTDTPCSGVTAADLTWTFLVQASTTVTTAPTGRAAYVEASSTTSSSYDYVGLSPTLSVECSARSGSTQAFARGSAPINDGQLHMLGCVADGTTLTAYVDGTPMGSAPLTGISAAARHLCTAGALRRGPTPSFSNFWQGGIGQVRTWDRALTGVEMQAESGDADGDGVPDASDCAPTSPGISALPGEVGNGLHVDRMEGESPTAVLRWSRGIQGPGSSVYRGSIVPGQTWTGPTCFASEQPETQILDGEVPPPGQAFYYLVSSVNACGESPAGHRSDGTPTVPPSCGPLGLDTDGDGVADLSDNCGLVPNPTQADADHDFVGSACDVCPSAADPDQSDADGDGLGDACDPCFDDDHDGVCGNVDNCPAVANAGQQNADADAQGDACDPCPLDAANDADADGACGNVDNCPAVANAGQQNADADAQGDACDPCPLDAANDADADGACGDVDNCPTAANPGQDDLDADGRGDACDNCPSTPNFPQADADEDGSGDACDPCPLDAANDADADGACGNADNCPTAANPGQDDLDADGRGDACDNCPSTPNFPQADADEDGSGDACDPCPLDAANDVDGDGLCGNLDNCPTATNPGQENADTDTLGDACDLCPLDPGNDVDGDGACGNVDNCPAISNPGQADADQDGIGDACDGEVVINEVHYDVGGQEEFIELFVAQGPVDLTGWTLSDGDEETFTFSSVDPRFSCPEPFVLQVGDHVVLWQGSGASVCSGAERHLYLSRAAFLHDAGDDLTLRDAAAACRDFVAFEFGPQVGAPPADCVWSGPEPSNGNQTGTSLSRFDGSPFLDTDAGDDWEASGLSTTQGPTSPGQANESSADGDGDGILDHNDNCVSVPNPGQDDLDVDGRGDACDNCPSTPNFSQSDADGDGSGDACDNCPLDAANDVDGDGVCGNVDNCPSLANPAQTDTDVDAQGDACDVCPLDASNDVDADGVCGNVDNCPAVFNPGQADADQDGTGDACESLPVMVTIKILEQDIRSDNPTWAQHRQQPTTRLGFRNLGKYRSLGRIDLSVIPAGAIIDDVRLVYWTTSSNPLGVGPNGDVPQLGPTITVELKKMLKAWNYDEPFTYPPSFSDNDTPATTGETSWNHNLFPATWEVPGATGPTDSVLVGTVGTVARVIDTRFDFISPALVPLVQSWLDFPATNHGFQLKAIDADEGPEPNPATRKILCGKGFPLETSTNLDQATAESHRPEVRITYHLP